jgi:hypothetical protein
MENIMTLIKQLILQTIEQNDGHCDWKIIKPKVGAYHFAHKISIPTDKQITHQAYLLEQAGAVERIVEMPVGIFYRITPWGHALLGPLHKRIGYFLLYKKNNLFALTALVVSIISLILSIFK